MISPFIVAKVWVLFFTFLNLNCLIGHLIWRTVSVLLWWWWWLLLVCIIPFTHWLELVQLHNTQRQMNVCIIYRMELYLKLFSCNLFSGGFFGGRKRCAKMLVQKSYADDPINRTRILFRYFRKTMTLKLNFSELFVIFRQM